MIHTLRSTRGMVVAPHHLAAQAGNDLLRDGGTAVEAMVAAAAAIAVVYPHMNALGGDGFWLIAEPGQAPIGIDACGGAARAASREYYAERGCEAIPARGPLAALTVPGTVAGWGAALGSLDRPRLPLRRLLEPAVWYARNGVAVTDSQAALTEAKSPQMDGVTGFAETFCPAGRPPRSGELLANPALADTLQRLAAAGPDDFYRGELAAALAEDLAAAGSPLSAADLAAYRPLRVAPLGLSLAGGRVYNMPPPTQGLASLLILGLFQRLGVTEAEGFEHLHGLVECTKRAFRVRDAHVTDPRWMDADPAAFLHPGWLDATAAEIPRHQATPWPHPAVPGDTIWMGAVDHEGRAVSFIQSIYWEFGSGLVLPATGVLMQNRGMSFSLDPAQRQALEPGRRPFHTLNPALARLADGRTLVYGTMGGEGQPQTQAAVFTRHVLFGQPLQQAVTAPRWLLGRTWGEDTTSLKLEDGIPEPVIEQLIAAGHQVERVPAFSDMMGHAGAIARHPDGLLEGAADPRSDGIVAAH